MQLGGRTSSEIVAWLKKKTGPPAKEIASVDSLKAFIDENQVAVVGFFSDKDSDNAKIFIEAASGIDDIPFAITSSPEGLKAYEVDKDSAVVVFKKVVCCLISL